MSISTVKHMLLYWVVGRICDGLVVRSLAEWDNLEKRYKGQVREEQFGGLKLLLGKKSNRFLFVDLHV